MSEKIINLFYCSDDIHCDFKKCEDYFIDRDTDDSALVGCRKKMYNGGYLTFSIGICGEKYDKQHCQRKYEISDKMMIKLRHELSLLDIKERAGLKST